MSARRAEATELFTLPEVSTTVASVHGSDTAAMASAMEGVASDGPVWCSLRSPIRLEAVS